MSRFWQAQYRIAPSVFGTLLAVLVLAPFFRLRFNASFYEIPAAWQFLLCCFGLVSIFWLFKPTLSSCAKVLRSPEGVLTFTWYSFVVLSIFLGENPLLSLKRALLTFFPALLIYFAIASSAQPQQLANGLVKGLVYLALINISYAFVGFLCDLWNTYPESRYGTLYLFGMEFSQALGQRHFSIAGEIYELQRYSGFFANPNGLGAVSAICLFLVLPLRQSLQRKFTIVFLVLILGLVLSGSRSALLMVLTGTIFLFLTDRISGILLIGTIMSSVVVFTAAIIVLTGNMLEVAVLPDWVVKQEFLIATIRGPYLVEAANVLWDYWLIGGGFGIGSELAFGVNADEMAIHSVLLNTIIETGILGLGALLAMWAYFVFLGVSPEIRSSEFGVLSASLSAILIGLFAAQSVDLSITRFHYLHLIFFCLLGLIASFKRIEAEQEL